VVALAAYEFSLIVCPKTHDIFIYKLSEFSPPMSSPLMRQGYYPRDEDYYVILDVDFNASPESITTAYRNLARKFHPDKHNQDERSRREAEVIFQKIKTAYDVLGDPQKRKIYDVLGPEGLKLETWKVVRKQMTAEDIREEYLRLQKQAIDDKFAVIAKPRASFTLGLDASELFRTKNENPEDYYEDELGTEEVGFASGLFDLCSSLTAVEIRSLSTSMSVDNNLAPDHTLSLTGSLNTRNGVGDGMFGLLYRYKYSANASYNLLYQIGRGPIVSAGFDYKFNDKTALATRGIIIFDSYTVAPAAKLTLTHKIRKYLAGKVSLREGLNPYVSTSLIYVNEKLMLQLTTTYKVSRASQSVSVDLGYRFNNDESKLSVGIVGSTNEGLAVEYGAETTIFTINSVGASLSLSLPAGVTLKLRFSRANQEYNVPIFLSDEVNSAPVFYGTIVPLVAYYIMDRCYLRHHKKMQ